MSKGAKSALGRLLKYTHTAVFDHSPEPELAFRLQHPLGAHWSIADRVLTVSVGESSHRFDLQKYSVDTLAHALTLAGYIVTSRTSRFSGISALVLVEGEGDEYQTNGDHIAGFNSILWVILSSYAGEILQATDAVRQALLQMVIHTSEAEWLDLWGKLYGTVRQPSEPDAHYAPRIPKEAFRLRCNARAIEQAILDATGFDVRIEEPWQHIFTLDSSQLSGTDAFFDGHTIGRHLIRPVTTSAVDWALVLAVIERNRAAGVLVLGPQVFHTSGSSALGHSSNTFYTTHVLAHDLIKNTMLLDNGPLDFIPVVYHPSLVQRSIFHVSGSSTEIQNWGNFAWAEAAAWDDIRYVTGSMQETRD